MVIARSKLGFDKFKQLGRVMKVGERNRRLPIHAIIGQWPRHDICSCYITLAPHLCSTVSPGPPFCVMPFSTWFVIFGHPSSTHVNHQSLISDFLIWRAIDVPNLQAPSRFVSNSKFRRCEYVSVHFTTPIYLNSIVLSLETRLVVHSIFYPNNKFFPK